jgi:hypothetical protein
MNNETAQRNCVAVLFNHAEKWALLQIATKVECRFLIT